MCAKNSPIDLFIVVITLTEVHCHGHNNAIQCIKGCIVYSFATFLYTGCYLLYFLTTACVPYTFMYRQRPLLAARCTTCGRSNVDFLPIHWNSLSAIQVGLKEGGKRQRRADVNWTTKENKLQLRRKTFDSSNMWQPASERLQVS